MGWGEDGRRRWEEMLGHEARDGTPPGMPFGNQSSTVGAMLKDISMATIKDVPVLLRGFPGLKSWHSRNQRVQSSWALESTPI